MMRTGFRAACLVCVWLIAGCDTDGDSPSTSGMAEAEDSAALQLESAVTALEREVLRVSDVNEIQRLQNTYGYYLDNSDWDNIVDLLTDDATAEYATSGVYRGKQSIRDFLYGIGYGERGLRPQQLREHIQVQPVITVAEDGMTAKGRWRVLALLGQFGEYARWQTGPYENEYRKENGVWKISRLHWIETLTVPVEGGWTTKMELSNVADRKFPGQDGPSTFTYEPWPAVSLLPYHFTNPVTGQE
ncbi:MAG: nuclear transport factor 2 family protein [Gammaproteobacteria bacterium]|nr:nuclear transport factor 2 family protein [Gammaproteobacteria bacterium]